MQTKFFVRFGLLVFLSFFAGKLFAQQVTVGTPFGAVNDSYYERYGVAWGLNWRGGFARFGMPNQPPPPFGKFDPSSGFQTGWHFGNRNFNGNIFFSAAQGSTRSFTSQTPFVTVMNGYPGMFYDLSWSPFVTGFIPVVGDYPMTGPMMQGVTPQNNSGSSDSANSLDRVQFMKRFLAAQNEGKPSETHEPDPGEAMFPRRDAAVGKTHQAASPTGKSTAERPATSVAEAKRLYELEKQVADAEVQRIFEQAQAAEDNGKPQVAKVYYQMIIKRTQGDLKQTAERRLQGLQAERR